MKYGNSVEENLGSIEQDSSRNTLNPSAMLGPQTMQTSSPSSLQQLMMKRPSIKTS